MEKISKLYKYINTSLHTPKWLFWLLLILFILRIPSFFEPYYYGDETIYLTLGEAIRQRIPLYKGIHDNKPPLLYIIAAVAGSLFWFKAILAIWSLITVYIFYKFVSRLFSKNQLTVKVSTIIFGVLTTIPLFEGNTANAELFMIGPTILAFYILLFKQNNFKNILISGMFLSTASLFKIPAAFEVPVIIIYWISKMKIERVELAKFTKKCLILALGFLIPIGLTFVWYFLRGAFREYLIAAFLENFGYLSSWRPDMVKEPFLVKNGPLLIRVAIVGITSTILVIKRRALSKQFFFVTLWVVFALFATTLSERPYPHYFVQALPAFSILWGMFFSINNIEQCLVVFPLSLAFIILVYFKFWQYHSGSYYLKFMRYTTGRITKDEYFSSFGNNVLLNYKLSDYLVNSTTKNDNVLVWGDSSHIYALSKRLPPIKYIADYHIKDFSNTDNVISALKSKKPRLIILLPNSKIEYKLLEYIRTKHVLIDNVDGSEIYLLVTPKT